MQLPSNYKKINANEQAEFIDLPNNGLRAYSSVVERGSSEEPLHTEFGSRDIHEIVDEWLSLCKGKLSHELPGLVEFEEDMASKVGPLSYRRPLMERLGDIDHYYQDILLSSEDIDRAAISRYINEISDMRGLCIKSPQSAALQLPQSTNAGLPTFSRARSYVLRDTLKYHSFHIDGDNVKYIDSTGSIRKSAAILGWRGQEGGPSIENVKQRVVWMFPFGVNIQEARVYQPFIRAAQVHKHNPAWISYDLVDQRMTYLFDSKGKDDPVICTDFSKFDQHFNPSMQKCAHDVYRVMFKGEDAFDEWLFDIFPIKFAIPLMVQYDHVRFGVHGMASGSNGTNCDESVSHRCLQHECALHNSAELNVFSQVQGDDGCLSYKGITVEQVVDSYSSHGQDMNPLKQRVSLDDAIYLRRYYSTKYRKNEIMRGVYAGSRVLGKCYYTERSTKGWSDIDLAHREIEILENSRWHPLFTALVKLVSRESKTGCGRNIPGFFEQIEASYASYLRNHPKMGNWNSRNMSSKRPISQWDSVRMLMNL